MGTERGTCKDPEWSEFGTAEVCRAGTSAEAYPTGPRGCVRECDFILVEGGGGQWVSLKGCTFGNVCGLF